MTLFPKRICLVITEDWVFKSHRFNFAKRLVDAGYQVCLITCVSTHRNEIEAEGIRVVHYDFRRGTMNPFVILRTIIDLIKLFGILRPQIVHNVALQPILCGTIAARMRKTPRIVNAFGGLGYLFVSKSPNIRAIRWIIKIILRITLKHPSTRQIVQNKHNYNFLIQSKLCYREQIDLVPGAGIKLSDYTFTSQSVECPLVILPARLLIDKGVKEFVAAARRLRTDGRNARFALVGSVDLSNPASLTLEEVESIKKTGVPELWGWVEDMPKVLSNAQIVCLPSYHEGFPKILLEAAASKCAIVASNIAGCRELISDNENGLLVEVGSVDSLCCAIDKLLSNEIYRSRLGEAAYQHVKRHNTDEIVYNAIVASYR